MELSSVWDVLEKTDIPSLPDICRRLTDATSDVDDSAFHVGDVICAEAGHPEWLLNLANSAMFQFPSVIDDVDAAVGAMGRDQVHDLVLAGMMMRLLSGVSPNIVSEHSFWKHSIACGIVARAIAAERQEKNIEFFFLAGVLHDIGSLFLYHHIPEHKLLQLLHGRDVKIPLHELEREVLGFDHAALSGALVREWALPEALWASVAHHHSPADAADYRHEAAVLHVADVIAVALEYGSTGEYCVPPLVPEAWEMVGLPVSVLPGLLEQVDQLLPVACRIFLHENTLSVDRN